MPIDCRSCHGQLDCLQTGSGPRALKRTFKVYQKIRSYAVWYFENMGVRGTLNHVLIGNRRAGRRNPNRQQTLMKNEPSSSNSEVLDLRPGELIEVKSVDDILATLGPDRKCRGLLWMTGMRKFCGGRYRVLKRVENILLESNGEPRKMRNTVSLEGVMCDGSEFGDCDRSCFHFWREAWLRRVTDED